MADAPQRKRRAKAPKPVPGQDRTRRDPADETMGDTKMVNAMETNPDFFRDPLIGKTIGKCKIEKYVGEGKTATVYRAHYEPLNRTVAMKVLLPHMTRIPAVLRVFQQEGRAVAILDHENILKIYDVGEDDGYYYMVLELLRGTDLLKVLENSEEGHLPVEEALDYVKQAARGLAAAHRKKLVHRDIKPQNMVVEPGGKLKIVDFGLAAEVEGAFAGGRLGTPHYMAPEQGRGEGAVPESDIYALGVTLFHLLVGHPPFAGRKTKEAIIEGHLEGVRFEPEKLRSGLPRGVGDIVRKMTRMDSASRPSARELIELIERFKPDRPGAQTPGRTLRSSRRSARRGSSASGLLVGGGVVGLAIVAFLIFGGSEGDGGSNEPGQVQVKPVASNPSGTVSGDPGGSDQPDGAAGNTKPTADPDAEQRKRLAGWFADAERAAKEGKIKAAHALFVKVMTRAPQGSDLADRAKGRAEELAERIDAATQTQSDQPRKTRVTERMNRIAGEEFRDVKRDLIAILKALRPWEVRAEVDRLLERTKKDSAERKEMEAFLVRVGYIEKLMSAALSRTLSLSGDHASWEHYDRTAPAELIVMSADRDGIKLKDEETEEEEILAWIDVGSNVLVRFFDAIRNEDSGYENVCMGYFCLLIDHDSASIYFDFAKLRDSSPEMAKTIADLQK